MMYSTIKQLSTQSKKVEEKKEIESVKGKVPLTPIQRWFLDENAAKLPHFNQSMVLETNERIHIRYMEDTIHYLIKSHDALRMKFYQDANKQWKQYNKVDYHTLKAFYVWDMIYEMDEERAIKDKIQKCQETLDIEKGQVIRVDIFRGKVKDYISIIIHHLVVDAATFRMIIEDIEAIYTSLLESKEVNLLKTASFKEWAEAIENYVQANVTLKEEEVYWQNICSQIANPQNEYVTCQEKGYITVALEERITQLLLGKTQEHYETKMNVLLLTALVRAVHNWDESMKVAIEIEEHSIEEIINNVNITRTVGWFASKYPVLLNYESGLISHIEATKAYLKNIPHKGIGYGVLKYLQTTPSELQGIAQIGFNYLGDIDKVKKGKLFQISNVSSENAIGKEWRGFHEIDINGSVLNGKMSFKVAYTENIYTKEQISMLAEGFIKELEAIANGAIELE